MKVVIIIKTKNKLFLKTNIHCAAYKASRQTKIVPPKQQRFVFCPFN